MAHLQAIQTGERIETHTHGRVFRFAAKRREERGRVASKEQRRVCVLSMAGARALEFYGASQPCYGPTCDHVHLTREHVEKMVADGIMKFIGRGRNVAGYTYGRTWKGVPSGEKLGPKVMQLV
jgi:hypothetical protein